MTVAIGEGAEEGLSRFTGEFSDKSVETRFRADQISETVRQAKFLFAAGAVTSVVFLAANMMLGGFGALSAIPPRLLVVLVSLACFLLAARRGGRYVEPLVIVWQCAVTLTAATLITVQQSIGVTAVFLLPAVFYLAVPTSFRATVASGAASSAVMIVVHAVSTGQYAHDAKLIVPIVLMNVLLSVLRSRSGRRLRIEWAVGRSYKKALRELQESRNLFERTYEAVPIPLTITDMETGDILRANEATERFLDVAPGSLAGRSSAEFYADAEMREAFTSSLSERGHVDAMPAKIRTETGAVRSVLLAGSVVAGKDGEPATIVASAVDMTEQEERERALRAAEAEYRALFENMVVGVYRSTPDGRMLRANPALARLNGYDSEAELVAAVNDIASEWYVEAGRREEWMRRMREDGRVTDFVSEVYRHKTRERIWISENSWTVTGADGGPAYFEGTVAEATERMQAEAHHKYLAQNDELTDLPNRRLLMERLEAAASQAVGSDGQFAVMCLDLDRFKAVNDAFGHSAGDLLLREAASRLKSVCEAGHTVARMGGDEFVILAAGLDHSRDVAVLADAIVGLFERPFNLDGPRAIVGTSIGIALAPEDGCDPQELLKKADLALYRAKSEGRNGYRFFRDEPDQPDLVRRAALQISAGRFR